ncbi:MAG: MBL fold metallo-hydrolase [Bacillota bacterium]|nr:MBL fold metallo-hydrolase [Bacillota bacterium]
MNTPKAFKCIGYINELNKRNFKLYFKPLKSPKFEDIIENSIHWVGHATTIINIFGKIIITDPVLTKRLGHLKRLVEPSIDLSSFHADYILLSHGHMDHLNYYTLKRLNKDCTIIVPKKFKRGISSLGFSKVVELGSDDNYTDDNLNINVFRANHDGKRLPFQKYCESNSYLITRKSKKVFFAGDTAFTDIYTGIQADAAIMPVGCYKPDEFQEMHCTPEQSFKMFKMMKVRTMIPVHYKTFVLAQDNDKDTTDRLNKINDGSIKIIDVGQTVSI